MLLWQIAVILIDLSLILAALVAFRYGMSALIGVDAKDELDKKDNFAFGLAVGGGVLSLMLIMSGAVSGEAQASLLNEAFSVFIYGFLGIVLLKVGFFIQDKILIRDISLSDEIRNGNLSAGIVTAVNLVAIGIIVRGAIYWSETSAIDGLLPVAIVYLMSQFILIGVTLLRTYIFGKRNEGKQWHQAIKDDNKAIAVRFGGQLLATSLAITSVGGLVTFSSSHLIDVAFLWLAFSLLMMLIVWFIYRASLPIILSKVNLVAEVDQQQNMGVAYIEAGIFVGIATILLSFIA